MQILMCVSKRIKRMSTCTVCYRMLLKVCIFYKETLPEENQWFPNSL